MPGNLDLPSLIFKTVFFMHFLYWEQKEDLVDSSGTNCDFVCVCVKKNKSWVLVMVFREACNRVPGPECSPLCSCGEDVVDLSGFS